MKKTIEKLVIRVMLIFCTCFTSWPVALFQAGILVPQLSFLNTLIQFYHVALACYCEVERGSWCTALT